MDKPRKVDPRKQFSKKLASRTEWFWFAYMILLLGLTAYRPEVAMTIVYISLIVTVVMIVSVFAYTDNSKYEKALFAAQEMAKIKFSWKHKGTEVVTASNVVEEKDDECEVGDIEEPDEEYEDGESNG